MITLYEFTLYFANNLNITNIEVADNMLKIKYRITVILN